MDSDSMDPQRRRFLDGDRPDDVLVYVSEEAVENAERLATRGERVEGGVVLVMDGERGRSVFQSATGIDPMNLASAAMGTDGEIEADLAGAVCPTRHPDEPDEDHVTRLVFAFAEERNEDVGGIYADGDVIHAYALCSCGTAFSDRWVVGDR